MASCRRSKRPSDATCAGGAGRPAGAIDRSRAHREGFRHLATQLRPAPDAIARPRQGGASGPADRHRRQSRAPCRPPADRHPGTEQARPRLRIRVTHALRQGPDDDDVRAKKGQPSVHRLRLASAWQFAGTSAGTRHPLAAARAVADRAGSGKQGNPSGRLKPNPVDPFGNICGVVPPVRQHGQRPSRPPSHRRCAPSVRRRALLAHPARAGRRPRLPKGSSGSRMKRFPVSYPGQRIASAGANQLRPRAPIVAPACIPRILARSSA